MKQFLKLSVGFFVFCVVLVGFIWMFAPKSIQPAFNQPSVAESMTINSAVKANQKDHISDRPAQDAQPSRQ